MIVGGLGQGAGIDVDDGGSDGLGDLDEWIGLDGGVDDFERRGIGAVAGSFLTAHSVSCEGATDEGGGDGGEQKERRCETVRRAGVQGAISSVQRPLNGFSQRGLGKFKAPILSIAVGRVSLTVMHSESEADCAATDLVWHLSLGCLNGSAGQLQGRILEKQSRMYRRFEAQRVLHGAC